MHEDGHVQGSDDNFGLVTSILTLQVSPLRGLTVYGALPLARAQAFSPAGPGSESESDLGNVSVGARYALRSGPLGYGASLAVFLPTSPDFDFCGSGDGGAVFTAMALQPERLSAFAPDTTTYRTGLDLRWQWSSTFVQAELAHQLPRGPLLHLNLLSLAIAAGVDVATGWSLVGQVDTTSRLLDPRRSAGDEIWWFTTSAGLRHQSGNLGLGARLLLPVDPLTDSDIRSAGLFVDLSSRF